MRTIPNVALKASLAATLALVVGCGGSAVADSTAPARDASFWEPITIIGWEVEQYSTLVEMAASADIVARGQIVDYVFSREITTDPPEASVTYSAMMFAPTEVLHGDSPELVPIEFLLSARPEDRDVALELQAQNMPNGEILVFLRHKGGAEAGLYRLVNSDGLWTVINGVLVAPVSMDADTLHERYESELLGVDNIDQLVDVVTGG
jgi:hypothetical protein